MKISSKRLVALALVAMMAVTFMLPQAYADSKGKTVPPGHSKGKAYWKIGFVDVDEDLTLEWAWQAIDKMYSKGVIIGYGNDAFKPKNNVTHLEAIIMAMRVMGWEEEAKSKKTVSGDISSIKVSWQDAYYYIAEAVERGIVKAEELRNFKPDVPAKRYEVARYIVRALDKEKEAQKHMDEKLPFKDAKAIPQDAVGYVYVISDLGLMIGDNNNVFQPNAPIKRAEMAMLLARLDDAVEEERGSKLVGEVKAIDEEDYTITIENSYGRTRYDVNPGARVYIGGKFRDLKYIEIGDKVELVLNDKKEVVFIQVIEASASVTTTSKGLVTEVNAKDNTLSLYTSLKNLDNAFVGTLTLSSIEGAHFELETDEGIYVLEGNIENIKKHVGDKIVVVGEITSKASIFMRGPILDVESFYGIRAKDIVTFKADKNTDIKVDGKEASLSKINEGYIAEVKAEGDKAIEIEAESVDHKYVKITTVKGLVTEVNTKANTLSLYTAAKTYEKTFIGTVRLSRIEGMHFELETDEGRYVLMGIVNDVDSDIEKYIGKKVVVTGKIIEGMSIYMRGPLLEVEKFSLLNDKDVITLEIDKNTEITVDGRRAKVADLKADQFAEAKTRDGLALEVAAKSVEKVAFTPEEPEAEEDEEVEGEIVAVSNKRIKIKNDDGEFTFEISNKVKLEGVRRLGELKVGAKVELKIAEGKVAEIELD